MALSLIQDRRQTESEPPTSIDTPSHLVCNPAILNAANRVANDRKQHQLGTSPSVRLGSNPRTPNNAAPPSFRRDGPARRPEVLDHRRRLDQNRPHLIPTSLIDLAPARCGPCPRGPLRPALRMVVRRQARREA